MAIVIETPRNFEFNKTNEKFSLGPGQYLPITRKEKHINGVSSSFQSKVERMKEVKFITPGPGSYYKDEFTDKLKKIEENEKIKEIIKVGEILEPNNTKNEYGTYIYAKDPIISKYVKSNIKSKKNYEKYGFTFNEKRFKETTNLKTPGPGMYIEKNEYKDQAKSTNKQCLHKKKQIKKLKSKMLRDRFGSVNSIPQKKAFGFELNSKGELIKKNNPEEYKSFTGVDKDTVGPGTYDSMIPEYWNKKGTNWSNNFLVRNDFKTKKEIKKEMEILKDKNKNNNQLLVDRIYEKTNNEIKINQELENYDIGDKNDYFENYARRTNYQNCEIYKSYLAKQVNREHIYNQNTQQLQMVLENKKNYILPGPGSFYEMRLHSGFYDAQKIRLYNKKFNEGAPAFNSSNRRFKNDNIEEIRNKKDNIGPGQYFNNDRNDRKKVALVPNNKKYKNSNIKKLNSDIAFGSTSERFNLNKSGQNLLKVDNYNNTRYRNKKKLNRNNSYDDRKKSNIDNQISKIKRKLNISSQTNKNKEYDYIPDDSLSSTFYGSVNNTNGFKVSKGTFFRKEDRFFEAKKEMERLAYGPGPGSYINAYSNTGNSNTYCFQGRYVDVRTGQKFTYDNLRPHSGKTRLLETYDPHPLGPPIGKYNPGKTYTIEWKNFYKGKKRYEKHIENYNPFVVEVSAAKYKKVREKDKGTDLMNFDKDVEYTQKKAPFSSTSERFYFFKEKKLNEQEEKQTYLGPGVYDTSSNYSLIKKSFNVKYNKNI